ncbi:lysylphosphatidylglycerol synthase domain-containing protein [Demequina sediminicola]|uniref:lysylphosphatidylglycerol synthase domain-containing protein n=1 Tax=Demequina sediminicola TaxID=1095026 RepID=UPI000785D678|nr:lysylphosphatidylglycerol synthase domain-containing protein [Demequina sediminicola]
MASSASDTPDAGRPRNRRKRWIRNGIALAVIGVVAWFFGRTLAANWDSLQEQDLSLGWWALGATVLFVVAVAVSGSMWGSLLHRLTGTRISQAEAIQAHYRAWLLKYIPGQVGFVMSKVVWGKARGLSRFKVLLSVVYENAFLLLGSTVPMIAILLLARGGAGDVSGTVWIALAAMVPLAAAMHPAVLSRVMTVLGKRTLGRAVPSSELLSTRTALTYQVGFLIPRVINGVGVVIIAVALADAAPESWIPLAAAYAIAGAVGIMAVFVPSGLGVRESVFVLFAAPYLGADMAILVSLVARVLATFADVLIAAIYLGLAGVARRRAGSTGSLPPKENS